MSTPHKIDKRFIGKKPNTSIALTRAGRRAIDGHWERLERLRQASTLRARGPRAS